MNRYFPSGTGVASGVGGNGIGVVVGDGIGLGVGSWEGFLLCVCAFG